MAETADEIRAGIEATRANLERKIGRIEEKARQELSLKVRVGRHPWRAVGAAAGLGAVLGLLRPRTKKKPADG